MSNLIEFIRVEGGVQIMSTGGGGAQAIKVWDPLLYIRGTLLICAAMDPLRFV
jgi:hypothetical protein